MQIMKNFIFMALILILTGVLNADCAPRTVYVKTAPPQARIEHKTAAPYANAVWVSGHWAWRNGKYVWKGGRWVKPRSGYVWIPGHWVKKRRGWRWIEGHWKKR
jgi:hypothetical protein